MSWTVQAVLLSKGKTQSKSPFKEFTCSGSKNPWINDRVGDR